MKIRQVFTVIRPVTGRRSVAKAQEDFLHVMDEKGEFLYGGSGPEEIQVKLEAMDHRGIWQDVTPA